MFYRAITVLYYLCMIKSNSTYFQIHSNPCFLKTSGTDDHKALTKDKPKVINDGDVISLLPDKLRFKVIYPPKK